MARDIVVFELIDQDKGTAKLDFRLTYMSLPAGAIPLAIVTSSDFAYLSGQYHTPDEVYAYAVKQSGYSFD